MIPVEMQSYGMKIDDWRKEENSQIEWRKSIPPSPFHRPPIPSHPFPTPIPPSPFARYNQLLLSPRPSEHGVMYVKPFPIKSTKKIPTPKIPRKSV